MTVCHLQILCYVMLNEVNLLQKQHIRNTAMLMKCSKCGYENQLNAIFCRGCGEKLNPAEVSPEALAQEAEKKKKASRKINWKPILGLVLLALAVTYGVMLFTSPSGAPVYNKENNAAYKNALEDVQDGYTTTVTPEQLTAFFNEELIDKNAAKSGNSFALKDVIFTGKGDLLILTIHTNLISCDATLVVTGKLKKGPDTNPVQFEITDFQFGNAPFFPFRDAVLKYFDSVFFSDFLKETFRNAIDVSFADGQLYIVQKKEARIRRPKKKSSSRK